MTNQIIDWKPSDDDAFQISVPQYVYYYAITADLEGKGRHYYKENKLSKEITEVSEQEIIDWVVNQPNKILKKCPCVVIKNGHLQPLVTRDNNSTQ